MALYDLFSNSDLTMEGPGKGLVEYKGGKSSTPTGMSNKFSYKGGLTSYLDEAKRKGLDVSNVSSASDLQSRIYDNLMSSPDGQSILKNMWSKFGDTLKGSGKVLPENLTDKDLAGLKSSFVDDKLGARTQMILEQMKTNEDPKPEPAPAPAPQRQYEGSPVYLPGVDGMLGGSLTNAMVGFLSKKGEFTPVDSADYEKYAVPKWAQDKMAAGEVDNYLKSQLGGYYKGSKKK